MKNDLEKRESIKNLILFLENNKDSIKEFKYLELFKKNINNLYVSAKETYYDSIEFDVPDNIEIEESNSYFYYSNSNTNSQKISIVNKNKKEFYFLTIDGELNYELIKYYKNQKNSIIVSKKDMHFNNIDEVQKCKLLILKSTINK